MAADEKERLRELYANLRRCAETLDALLAARESQNRVCEMLHERIYETIEEIQEFLTSGGKRKCDLRRMN